MILNYSWIAFFMLGCILYWYIKGTIKENLGYVGICLFFALFFFALDYQFNELRNDVIEVYSQKQIHEYCDLTSISSDCYRNETLVLNESEHYTQLYLGVQKAQFENMKIISNLTIGAAALFVLFFSIDNLKKMGLIK